MIYSGEFADINGTNYKVQITTEGNTPSELTLGVPPFVTEMDSSEDIIYKPVKYQSATVKIISGDYLLDIYSGTAQGTKVELLQGNEVKWTGYVTPNLYDMGFDEDREEVEIECIDALSTLQYYKYQSANKGVVRFVDIIDSLLSKCNAYQHYYISGNIQLEDRGSILDKLYISEQNFFDEKEDADQTDNDVAWTCQEVLEEICQYLGCTAIADGDSVYFLDYDAIKNGVNTYYRYAVGDANHNELVTVQFSKQIQASDYSENGATLSLDNVYNKVTVEDDFYKFENVIPDMFENLVNITKASDTELASSTNVNNGMYGEVVQSEVSNAGDKTNNNMIVMLDRTYNPQKSQYKDYNAVFVKYFTNPNYKFYKYNGTTRSEVTELNYTDTKNFHGAFIAKFGVKKLDETFSDMQQAIIQMAGGQITLDNWLAKNQISSVDFSDYIVLINSATDHISNDNITDYPYLETRANIDTNALFGGANSYLVISGSVNFHYFSDDPYPIPESESDISEGRYTIDDGEGYLLAKLQWGDRWWTGSYWSTREATFKIPYVKDGAKSDDRRADNLMFKDNAFVNSVTWRIGTKAKGHLITIDNDVLLDGVPILTLYKPYDPTYTSHGQYYKSNCVFLKNFQIKAIVGDPTFSDANDTDTVYTNVINDAYCTELDEVKFKICTNDLKNPNFSCVAYQTQVHGSTVFKFVDTVNNLALANLFTGVTRYDGTVSDGSLRMEEQLIYRVTNQYQTPSIKLQLNLRNDNKVWGLYTDTTIRDKQFIIDSINTDYKMNQQEVTLIEKK